MSVSVTNGALVMAVRERIEQAYRVGHPTPGRRVLAAELDVSEYAVRRVLDEIGRAPAGEGGRPASPDPAPENAQDGSAGETGWPDSDAEPNPATRRRKRATRPWPLVLLALPAFVAIWGGWVGLAQMAGFGVIHLLPGIWDELRVNTAVTLPIGLEVYAAYALRVWLSGAGDERARRFARTSALSSLGLGATGQIAYHLMVAAGTTAAPWWITAMVATLPVAVLGMGAALAHLITHNDSQPTGNHEK